MMQGNDNQAQYRGRRGVPLKSGIDNSHGAFRPAEVGHAQATCPTCLAEKLQSRIGHRTGDQPVPGCHAHLPSAPAQVAHQHRPRQRDQGRQHQRFHGGQEGNAISPHSDFAQLHEAHTHGVSVTQQKAKHYQACQMHHLVLPQFRPYGSPAIRLQRENIRQDHRARGHGLPTIT